VTHDVDEAVLLADRVGAEFDAVVLDDHPGTVALADPPVRGRCDGDGLNPGARIRVRLMEADPARRKIRFGLA